jgi:hypothetical protein
LRDIGNLGTSLTSALYTMFLTPRSYALVVSPMFWHSESANRLGLHSGTRWKYEFNTRRNCVGWGKVFYTFHLFAKRLLYHLPNTVV